MLLNIPKIERIDVTIKYRFSEPVVLRSNLRSAGRQGSFGNERAFHREKGMLSDAGA